MADKLPTALYINNEPFNVTSYFRSATPDLVSRFGSAEQGQTNLDILKAETQKTYRGGMFQRNFDDPEKASSITNAYFNRNDSNLYPTQKWKTALSGGYAFSSSVTSSTGMSPNGVNSHCFYKGFLYYTFQTSSPGAIVNKLYKLDPASGAVSDVPLHATLANSSTPLRLLTYNTWMLISGRCTDASSANAATYDGTTFTISGSGFFEFAVFNDKLYGIDPSGNFYQVTAVSAGTFTHAAAIVSQIGNLNSDHVYYSDINKMLEYNGALYIATKFGLFRFDGVSVKPVIDMRKAIDWNNFKYVDVFNGRLYYNIKDKLYKFDGTNIELLQDFTDAYRIRDIMASPDRLWISTVVDSGVLTSDKFSAGGPAYSPSVFCYDDVGFFEYSAFTNDLPISYTRMTLMNQDNKIFLHVPDVYFNVSLEERSNGSYCYMIDLDYEFATADVAPTMTVVSSVFDCNYPSVQKALNGFNANFKSVDGEILVEVQYFDNNAWGSWLTILTGEQIDADGITNDYLLHDQSFVGAAPSHLSTTPATFKKMRYRITLETDGASTTSMPYLSDSSIRYTLQPTHKLKWLLEIDLQGLDKKNLTTPRLSNGDREARSATYLRRIIYDAFLNKLPVLLYDFDWSEIKTLPAGDAGYFINGTDFLELGDHIAIQTQNDGWLNRSVKNVVFDDIENETEFDLKLSGYRKGIGGADAANSTIAVGDQVRRSYSVYIKDIRNERYILDPNNLNSRNGFTDIASKITVEIVEI